MMFDRARTWPERRLFRFHRDGAWQEMRWDHFARRAAAAARGFRAMRLGEGDRVVICSENRPEVTIAEVALMAIRAVPVPAYATNTVDDHAHVIRDSGARLAIGSTPILADRLAEAAGLAGGVQAVVAMDAPGPGQVPFAALLRDADRDFDDVADEAAAIPPDQLACLLYTSGTGGAPKGVMLPHRAMLSNCAGAYERLLPLRMRDEVYLSFLPVSHSYEHTVGQFFLPSIGTEVVFGRGLEHLAADMLEARPSLIVAVPRLLDVLRGRILAGAARQPRWKQRLFHRAVAAGIRRADGRAGLVDRLADPLLDRLARAPVRARFGGRLRAVVSGSARLDPELGRFFQGLGLVMMQGYGQTESGPVISVNPPDRARADTVGPPLAGVELRLAEDGEILVRGALVMDGYWNRPEATAAAIRDGWLHTGDVGTLDSHGYLRITDRKKDFIALSGGDKVSPARVEAMLMAEPEIAQAVIAGEGETALSALLVPARDDTGDDMGEGAALAAAVRRANARLAGYERIRRHATVPAFTIENGLLTPTGKIRRGAAIDRHAAILAGLRG